MGFRLSIVAGKGEGREFFFAQPVVRIGRDPESDLVLYDTAVSRHHYEIIADAQRFTMRDIGSSNGTLLNERVTTEGELKDGDRIGVGPVIFEFKQGKASRAAKPTKERVFEPSNVALRKQVEEQKTAFVPRDEQVLKALKQQAEERRRTDTGSFRALKPGLLRRFRKLSPTMQRAVLVAAGLLIAAITVAVLIATIRPKKDRSGELFAINAETQGERFGAGRVDVFTPDRVNFKFPYEGGRIRVGYAVGGIEGRQELRVMVNGKEISYAPLSPNDWTSGLTVDVPRSVLTHGTNILTFDNTSLDTEERWAVSQVQVTETPLPPADAKRAEQLYELGKTAFETRSVAPQNLWRAVGYLDEALTYIEGQSPAPPLLGEVLAAADRAKAELQSTFDSHIFAAEKALRFGDKEQAATVLRELLRYFPDTEDVRNKQAKARLNGLSSGAIE